MRPVIVEMAQACTFPDCDCDSPYRAAGACVKPAQAAERAATDLHAQIMRLPANVPEHVQARTHSHWATWREGFRDARQAAAELARAAVAALPAAPTLPAGWNVRRMDDGAMLVSHNAHGGCIVRKDEEDPRAIPSSVLYALASDMLAAAPALPAAPAEPTAVAWIRYEWSRTGPKTLVWERPENLSLREQSIGVEYVPLGVIAAPAPAARVDAPERESVDDALLIVQSYGPWGADLNDAHRRQIVLADEVVRLRGLYAAAVQGRADFRQALRECRATAPAAAAVPVPLTDEQAETLIEASDGRWTDGEFRIDGPDLMRLLRSAAGIKQQPGGAG